MTFKAWCKVVDDLFQKKTGCSWADLCGDTDTLETGFQNGELPNEFVDWYIGKYDLDELAV